LVTKPMCHLVIVVAHLAVSFAFSVGVSFMGTGETSASVKSDESVDRL
jgi:hypothetical protein